MQLFKNRGSRMPMVAVLVLLISWMTGCRQPEAPEYFGFQNLQLSRTSGSLARLTTTVKLYNPNPYNLQLRRAELDISINGKHAGHSLLDSTLHIPKKDTFYVPIAVDLDLKAVLGNVIQLMMEKEATISLDGRVKIKKGMMLFNRPFHYDGKQDIKSLLGSF